MNYERIYNQIIERAKSEYEQRLYQYKNGVYYEGHHIIPRCMGGTGRSNQWKRRNANNRDKNIVPLTAKEHYVCHRLLCEMYPDSDKLKYAFWALCNGFGKNKRYKPSGITVAKLRENLFNCKRGKTYEELYGIELAQKLKKYKSDLLKTSHPLKGKFGINSPNYGNKRTAKFKTEQSIRMSGKSNPMYGYTYSEDQLRKKSENQIGVNNSFYGKVHSDETKIKLSNFMKSRDKVYCVYCDRSYDPHNYKRWHGDKCKKI